MDPERMMAEQERIVACARGDEPGEADLDRLQELVEALDDWFAAGGFIPKTRTPAGCRRQREDAMAVLRAANSEPFCRCETCTPGDVTCVSRD